MSTPTAIGDGPRSFLTAADDARGEVSVTTAVAAAGTRAARAVPVLLGALAVGVAAAARAGRFAVRPAPAVALVGAALLDADDESDAEESAAAVAQLLPITSPAPIANAAAASRGTRMVECTDASCDRPPTGPKCVVTESIA